MGCRGRINICSKNKLRVCVCGCVFKMLKKLQLLCYTNANIEWLKVEGETPLLGIFKLINVIIWRHW